MDGQLWFGDFDFFADLQVVRIHLWVGFLDHVEGDLFRVALGFDCLVLGSDDLEEAVAGFDFV